MRTLITIFLTLLLSGCQWSNADLGDSYYYLDSLEAIDIGSPNGAIIYKSSSRDVFENIIIKREVIQVTHNDKYILAKQFIKNNNPDTNFYLIDKKLDKVYGPMNSDSLEIMRQRLDIEIKL